METTAEKLEVIPFGNIYRDRFDISKKYGLIEMVAGIWRLTSKCKENYELLSYFKYLRGDIEKPVRISERKQETKQKTKPTVKQKLSGKDLVIRELLML
jgi:hypothetical protein